MNIGARKISEDIFMLTLPMPFRLEHVNVYAVVKNGHVSLIDTGPNLPEAFPTLERLLGEIGKKVSDVVEIFVTHFHADHCGLAGTIQEISGAAVYMGEKDYRRTRTDMESVVGLMESFFTANGMPAEVFGRLAQAFRMFRHATVPFTVDRFLVPGERTSVGGEHLEVIGSAGHTSGQLIYFLRERGLLFSGDHVLPHITPNLSPDVTNLGFRPLSSFIASLESIANLPADMVYPAHGSPFKNLKARVEEIKAHHEERKMLILKSVSAGPKSAYDISRNIFGEDLTEFDKFLALNETYVHLVELEAGSLVKCRRVNGIDLYST